MIATRRQIPPLDIEPLDKSGRGGGYLWVAVIFGALAFEIGDTLFQARADRRCVASGGWVALDDRGYHACSRCDGTECGPGIARYCPGAPPTCSVRPPTKERTK